jgi:hypothetical protein
MNSAFMYFVAFVLYACLLWSILGLIVMLKRDERKHLALDDINDLPILHVFQSGSVWCPHCWEIRVLDSLPLICLLHAGYGANGAIIHYRPTPDSCNSIGSDNLFLLDSGAQYIDGTTDITRTVHFGEPSPRQKECFTRVLQVCNFL